LNEIGEAALQRQFARTPYAVSFKAGEATFILTTLHVTYGRSSAERIPELMEIARWMREWADRESVWSHKLITLGDFNIDRQSDPLWVVFTSTGLTAPAELNAVPRTIFSDPDQPETNKFYDQIAWFETNSGLKKLAIPFPNAGHVDFLPYVYTDKNLSRRSISYRVSDHYPLWAKFAIT